MRDRENDIKSEKESNQQKGRREFSAYAYQHTE